MPHILVFGDSIGYGAWDREGGWASRLRRYIEDMNPGGYSLVYNLSISGETSRGLLERIEREALPRMDEEVVTLIAVGINDSALVDGKENIPLQEFRSNVREIFRRASLFSKGVAFVGLTPVDDRRTSPVPWDTAFSYSLSRAKEYDRALREECRRMRAGYVDVLAKGWSKDMLSDGLHPNEKGHENIFRAVRQFLVGSGLLVQP